MDITDAMLRVSNFFRELEIQLPDFHSKKSLKQFKADQDVYFEDRLSDLQRARADWAKENLKLYQLEASKNPDKRAIELQKNIVEELHAVFHGSFSIFMVARAREEVARALPRTIDVPSLYGFVIRQLETARSYLKMN